MTEPASFERLLAGPCPPPGELLLALAGEFGPVDRARADGRLDELARGLFSAALAGEPRMLARGLAELLMRDHGFRADDRAAAGLLMDAVLERRAGHPLALAALGAEIGRRAGATVAVCSTATGWYAAVGEDERLWLIEAVAAPAAGPAGAIRPHCGHEVAWAALTGLYARFLRDGELANAARAAELRARLPVARH